ncbi:UNVERIFIED_CONTAM: hypothetical protein LK11_07080 [Mumia flava]
MTDLFETRPSHLHDVVLRVNPPVALVRFPGCLIKLDRQRQIAPKRTQGSMETAYASEEVDVRE